MEPSGAAGRIYSGRHPACHIPGASKQCATRRGYRGGGLPPPRFKWNQVEPQAGFTPAVILHVTFQAPPSYVQLGGGTAVEACLPRALNGTKWSRRPDL